MTDTVDNLTVPLSTALALLARMGDLSMGQPIDHSEQAAACAAWLAREAGADVAACVQVALLRWVGCTANADNIAALLDDDVAGRRAMLALRPDKIGLRLPLPEARQAGKQASDIHCEVASLVATMLGLSPDVARALGHVFERWDGGGYSQLGGGDAIPLATRVAVLASDMEILSREYGSELGIAMLRTHGDGTHDPALLALLEQGWKAGAEPKEPMPRPPGARDPGGPAAGLTQAELLPDAARHVPLALVADLCDLKLAWLVGHSRAMAGSAAAAAQALGIAPAPVARAALLQGLGRVAIPQRVWNAAGTLNSAQWEQVRLYPYRTARALGSLRDLAEEAELASHIGERLDGSGYYRGAGGATALAARILPAASCWLALRAARPWRGAFDADTAAAQLQGDVQVGRLDGQVVAAMLGQPAPVAAARAGSLLSPRETEVLAVIARGMSNKEAARQLGLSPSTVRTHMENLFRKLECNSRAAATLKAAALGLIGS
ncbi:HD domain-containing protein [Pseudoduganella ginsengisoli]|uniref:Winged helix-turn-helix transcriptional regulator n=1 Tax=Pseudoduganella ginsengisoli TaxID=1462440 RepID=A0A6L6PTG8_9BURK|nr:HD domain-containing phosphohydrolase [Pseudoduganella ginsengisoli]MTW00780.1 winged helix-turn-helix transcriptional regulator [Pseudoduganella ginsengisoli]